MGISPFKNCSTNYGTPAPAPNPDPSRWTLLERADYPHGSVMRVRYHDCTNFEGEKVMVYRGIKKAMVDLDPHFSENPESPIARFRPDDVGWKMACDLAASLPPEATCQDVGDPPSSDFACTFDQYREQAAELFRRLRAAPKPSKEQIQNGVKALGLAFLYLKGSDNEKHQAEVVLSLAYREAGAL